MPSKVVRKRVEEPQEPDEFEEEEAEEVVLPKVSTAKTVVPPGLSKAAMKQLGWQPRLTVYVGSQLELNRLINKDRDLWTPQTDQPQIVGQYELIHKGALIIDKGTEKNPILTTNRVVMVRKLTSAELEQIKADKELDEFRREQAEAEEQEALKAWRARKFAARDRLARR